jgi:hypothetical protein
MLILVFQFNSISKAIIMVAVFKLYWSIPRFNDYWMAICNYDDDENYFSGGYCC